MDTQRSNTQMPKYGKTFILFSFLFVFILGGGTGIFISDYILHPNPTFQQAQQLLLQNNSEEIAEQQDIQFDLFWLIWETIESRHINTEISDADLFYNSIAGLVAGTQDPHSVFFSPEKSEEFFGEINGNFEGIGAEIAIKNDVLTVIAPLQGSPAQQAGILAGDSILGIDGLDTSYMSTLTAVQHIRGEKGTTVTLTIQRNEGEPFEVVVQRDTIVVEPITHSYIDQDDKTIGVIEIRSFTTGVEKMFYQTLQEMLLEQPDGFIIDLRNNPGGYLQDAVDMISAFLPEGKAIVYEQRRDVEEIVYTSSGTQTLEGYEVVVLVNEGSASASEIMAGALQDHDRALILGEQTFGKGTVQEVISFPDNSALKLTIAQWLTPNKTEIDGTGISPDITVERTLEDFNQDIDPQKDAAIQYFTDRTTFDSTYNTEE